MKKLFLFLFLFSFLSIQAQDSDFRLERKGKLFFNVGVEYRITPLPTDGVGTIPEARATNPDKQNSGSTIYYGLKFFATKNFSLGFSHSLRYTLLNNNSGGDIPTDFGYKESVYKLMMGYHFYLDYHVKVFENAELFARIGISMINTNSIYVYKEPVYDNNGEVLGHIVSELDYKMYPKNFAIGYKKNKLEAILGIYVTNDPPYFDQSVMYIIPYINLNYTIGKF